MDINILPNDLLRFIVNTYNCFKLMYTCSKFKNIVCERLSKCDKCEKNIMIDKNDIWENGIYGCHLINNFIVNNNIIIVEKNNMIEFITSLKDMAQMSSIGKLIVFNNTIRIITEFANFKKHINTLIIYDENLKCIEGSYYIKLNRFNNINLFSYVDEQVSIIFTHNKYTKNIHNLHLIFKTKNYDHRIFLEKIENEIC